MTPHPATSSSVLPPGLEQQAREELAAALLALGLACAASRVAHFLAGQAVAVYWTLAPLERFLALYDGWGQPAAVLEELLARDRPLQRVVEAGVLIKAQARGEPLVRHGGLLLPLTLALRDFAGWSGRLETTADGQHVVTSPYPKLREGDGHAC